MANQPIAFLLVKFKNSPAEPITNAAAVQMFTAAGRGTLNVVDWFDDNTHGRVDMTGNAVFGWLPLTQAVGDYKGSGLNPQGRADIITWGKQAAATAGISLSNFSTVVVVTNVGADLFGSTGGVCCTAAPGGQFWELQAAPSVLCQEMIHGLGIPQHARRHGSDADYGDPYDVMSMFNASPGHHPANWNVPVGPGLNAAFMARGGWLDTARAAPFAPTVALRPLHRRDLPGALYAMVGGYYVEYRPSQRWDTGFGSIVLVHYVANDTSYLAAELRAGDEFSGATHLMPCLSIRVDAIDAGAQTATLAIRRWHWLNMGKPPNVNLRATMGAVTVMDTPTSPQRAHVFMEGNDFNLWCRWSDGAAWHWLNMGKPPNVNLRATMGAVTVMDTPTSPQRAHVFMEGNDFNLWCRWSDGAAWHWLNMGKPPNVNLRATMGAVTVMDTPTSPQRAHVFMEGNDFNLWCRWSDGAAWHWLNMGKPPNVNLRTMMGAVTVMDTPTSPQRAHVFMEGNDFNLWCRWSDGAAWHWLNMGKPPGVNLRAMMGAVTVRDTPTSPQRAHVFIEGNDFNLWCRWSDGAAWHWLNMGKPAGVNLRAMMGAVTVKKTPTSPECPLVFIEGSDSNLWCRWSDGAAWYWTNMGKPAAANLRARMGTVTVMDTTTATQRPHTFVEGDDFNLWCHWLG